MLSSVASAIQELTTYGKLMSEGSTREAAGHLKAASSLVRRLPRPKQTTQQGTPLESSFRPTIDSVTFARSGDLYTLLNSAIRQLTEYTQFHFKDEEQLMPQIGIDARYRELHGHLHHDFVAQIGSMWSLRFSTPNAVATLHQYLCSWLALHILGEDQFMARQAARVRQGMSSEEAY